MRPPSCKKQEKPSEMPHDDMQLSIPLWCLGMTPSDSLGTCLVVSASSRGIPLLCRPGVQQGNSPLCLGMTPSDCPEFGTCLVVSASSRVFPSCAAGRPAGYDTVCLEFRGLLLLIYDDIYTLCSCLWQECVASGASFPAPPAI